MTATGHKLYAFLTLLTGNRAGTNFPLDASRKTLIGRGTDCHITVPDPISSRVHAALSRENDAWIVRDCDSRNGTVVNGKPTEEALLQDEDIIEVGDSKIKFIAPEKVPT